MAVVVVKVKQKTMKIKLPIRTMTDQDLLKFVKKLQIPNFTGVYMRDELISSSSSGGNTQSPHKIECGILNFNTHVQRGSHWTCWYKCGKERYYFDSFGEQPPFEILRYLKTVNELRNDEPVIRRSAITVQHDDSSECGALCLYVLKQLSIGVSFSIILSDLLKRYKSPTKSRRRLVLDV